MARYTGEKMTIHAGATKVCGGRCDEHVTVSIGGATSCGNYYTITMEDEVRNITMRWLNERELREPMTGLLFLLEDRSSVFNAPTYGVRAQVIKGELAEQYKGGDWTLGLLVQGFTVPAKHPAIGAELKATIHTRGKIEDNNARTVYKFMSDEDYGFGIYAGFTVHDTRGSWSSWPVHEFELQALAAPITLYPDFSERFALLTQPRYGWCMQAVSSIDGDGYTRAHCDGDIITIPLGAHPIVAMPGSRLAYFWAYKGASKKDF